MRLTLKLTLVLSLVIACGLLAQSFMHVQRVRALQVEEARDDLQILARALGAAITEIWSTQGEARARDYVQRADERRARIRVRLVTAADGPAGELVEPTIKVADNRIVGYIDVRVGAAVVGRLELVRTRSAERAFTRGLIWSQLATAAAVIGACGALALVVGFWLVGRPVEQLIEHSRRVASGDFAAPELARARDELGKLAIEMTTMTSKLADAERAAHSARRARARAFEQLRHADRLGTVGELASGLAHELGTPLNVASGRAALIVSDEGASERIRKGARTIVTQCERMEAIVRQLLDYSRRDDIERERAPAHEILVRAVELVEPLAEDRGVRVVIDGPSAEVSGQVDGEGTLQVLTNLMVNGVHAMPDGGVMEVSVEQQVVDTPKERRAVPGEFVCFSVRDQGSGISAEDIERIFEPFFTTKGAGEGTGLGLSVAHGIARERGGWIEVESELGEGSCFRVYLPMGGSV